MRIFTENQEERFDKGHAILLFMMLAAVILWINKSSEVYKQKVQYDEQISSLKSELLLCLHPQPVSWDEI